MESQSTELNETTTSPPDKHDHHVPEIATDHPISDDQTEVHVPEIATDHHPISDDQTEVHVPEIATDHHPISDDQTQEHVPEIATDHHPISDDQTEVHVPEIATDHHPISDDQTQEHVPEIATDHHPISDDQTQEHVPEIATDHHPISDNQTEEHVPEIATDHPISDNHTEHDSDSGSDSDDGRSTSSSTASSPPHKHDKIPRPPTQPPPNQEMYRIPPAVFERNKSSTPGEWSGASNESLFSIHMGNMSFANTDNYVWKSGELGPPTASASEQMFSYSAHSSTGGAADMRSRELGLAEATMLEVIKENEGRSPPPSIMSEVRNTRRSGGSNHSNMSFAFSVAGGDTERMPRSVSSSTTRTQGHSVKKEEQHPDVQTPATKEKEARTQSRWCFCFPCCSNCWG